MNTPQGKAIRLLRSYVGPHFDLWSLAGRDRVASRALILTVLLSRSVTRSESGINALQAAFYAACGITGETPNERDDNFREFCRTHQDS